MCGAQVCRTISVCARADERRHTHTSVGESRPLPALMSRSVQQHAATLPSEVPLESVEYMDHVMQPVIGSAGQLCHKGAAVASIIQLVFASFALAVKWGPGKSEAMVHLRSNGAVAAA